MDNKICKIHNESVLFCEKDAKQNLIWLCRFCIQQKFNVQNAEDVDKEQKYALQQLEQKYDQSINKLKDFDGKLDQYTQQIQQKLKKFKQQVEQNIQEIINKKNQINNQSNNFTNLQLNQINEEENLINNQYEQIKQQINNQLKVLEVNTKLDQLYKVINNFPIQVNSEVNKQIKSQEITEFNKKFDYRLIQKLSYKQNEQCCAIAFNQNQTLMIAGCDNLIKVFEFKDNKLKVVQQLDGHQRDVTCLQFIKKSNQFISASHDSTIMIWEYSQKNQWKSNQVLKGHTSSIVCITINQNEDLLMSGSKDETIQFWIKQNNIWISNQSVDCQREVYSTSLSNQEDKLIASVYGKQILIIQLQDKQWIIKQKISVEYYGNRLCFINQDQFVFQPTDGQHLQIFDYDPKDETFKIGQKLQYSNKESDGVLFFPIHYISQIGLLMVKHGLNAHLIKRNQNGQFTIEQSIKFNTKSVYGGISDDGRYIATWDVQSYEIQIRKFDY